MRDVQALLISIMIVAAFFGTWIAVAIVVFAASRRMNAAAKRRWIPRAVILLGVLFIIVETTLFVLESGSWSSLGYLALLVPLVGSISYLQIKLTKYCDKCNATIAARSWFEPARFCSKCGAPVDTLKPARGDGLLE